MSVIKINAITVREGAGDELARRFAHRAGAVDDVDGFEGFELLQPDDGRDTWLVVTRWRDDDSFNAWVSSPAFAHGHRGDGSRTSGEADPQPVGRHSELWSYRVVDLPRPDMTASGPDAIPLHRRAIDFEAFDMGEELLVIGRLRDTRPWAADGATKVHDMELRVRVRRSDMVISECTAVMHTFPHAECPGIVAAFAALAGLSVTRGFTRAVQSLVSGPNGCTHLDQLARAIGPVVVQAVTSRRARELREGRADDLLTGTSNVPWARNSCHVWAEDGVAEQKLAAGWRPGRGPYPAPPLEDILAGAGEADTGGLSPTVPTG